MHRVQVELRLMRHKQGPKRGLRKILNIKLKAHSAEAKPPLTQILGSCGVMDIRGFCSQFNERTAEISEEITIFVTVAINWDGSYQMKFRRFPITKAIELLKQRIMRYGVWYFPTRFRRYRLRLRYHRRSIKECLRTLGLYKLYILQRTFNYQKASRTSLIGQLVGTIRSCHLILDEDAGKSLQKVLRLREREKMRVFIGWSPLTLSFSGQQLYCCPQLLERCSIYFYRLFVSYVSGGRYKRRKLRRKQRRWRRFIARLLFIFYFSSVDDEVKGIVEEVGKKLSIAEEEDGAFIERSVEEKYQEQVREFLRKYFGPSYIHGGVFHEFVEMDGEYYEGDSKFL